MSQTRETAVDTIRAFLERAEKSAPFDDTTSLFGEGLGLDSLEVAELSSMLEDALGTDPFSAGIAASTVGEILSFYDAA